MERKRSGSLGSFIRQQASSHSFLLFLSLGKQWSLTLLLLLPFDWKLQPKATQCGIVSVFYFESCVAVKSTSSSPSATIWRHRCRMYCAHKIMAPPPHSPKMMLIFLNNIHFHGFSTTYFSKRHHLRYVLIPGDPFKRLTDLDTQSWFVFSMTQFDCLLLFL